MQEVSIVITLKLAQSIIEHALLQARKSGFRPLSVAVLDARAAVIAVASEDGASFKRFQVAHGKAHGALSFNLGSRALGVMAAERPHFFAGAAHAVGGALIPVAGGVLIKNTENLVLGAVGVSGDTSDNDDAAAVAGIVAAGYVADGG
jgi:uncharacterized protein GlcG (DUF336 family)